MKLFDKVMIAAGLGIIGYWCWDKLSKKLSKARSISELCKQLDASFDAVQKLRAEGGSKDEIVAMNCKFYDIAHEIAKLLPGDDDRKIVALAAILFDTQKKVYEKYLKMSNNSSFNDMVIALTSEAIATTVVRKGSAANAAA